MQAFIECNFAWLWIVTNKKRASGDGHSFVLESSRRDSNPWSIDYESIALPTEPRKRFEPYYIMIPEVEGFVKGKMKVHAVCNENNMAMIHSGLQNNFSCVKKKLMKWIYKFRKVMRLAVSDIKSKCYIKCYKII